MAERKRIALIYSYNENWIGGTYYIENLVAALAQLPDSQQPELVVYTWEVIDASRLRQAVQYAHWSFRQFERTLSLPQRILNKVTAVAVGRRYISSLYDDVDLVFPLLAGWRYFFSKVPHHLYWIPDFQEHYLPSFFKPEEITERKAEQQLVVGLAKDIVFSSHAAQKDFNTIYPDAKLNQHVLQFSVTNKVAHGHIDAYLAEYEITEPYFICSNQFWKHKNHPVLLKAIAAVRASHPNVMVVFTGKEYDNRNPTYFEELMALKESLGLQKEVKFLGFIPRENQIVLMQAAIAVIQPSLFEGWSTVIEDAKSLNVPVLASSLDVNKEQLASYGAKLLFDPQDSADLSRCMARALDGHLPRQHYNYQKDMAQFGHNFTRIINQITDN